MRQVMAADFLLCADPHRDEAIRPLVGRAVAFLLDHVGGARLDAVILTGSLARGEGSVLLGPEGVRLLGDVEFLVILKPRSGWPEVRRHMVELSRRARHELGDGGRRATIEYGAAGIEYLRRKIRPSIFAYDLLSHGKVVWGRSDILSEIRPFGVASILREDAIRLVMNRIVELLLVEDAREATPSDTEARAYQAVKSVLDLAGSALAFAGRYVSRYGERQRPFRALLASSADLRATLPAPAEFEEQLDWATRCKLAPTAELLFDEAPARRIASVPGWARGVWVWEMRRLLGSPSGQFLELLEGWMRREPFRQRLKGWAKYCLHPLRPRGALAPVRAGRLFLRASPHTLVYAAALLAHEGLTAKREGWAAQAASLLPVPVRAQNGAVLREACALWRWLIRND